MRKNLLQILIITIVFLLLDQITKQLVATNLIEPFNIIDGFFELRYSENTGIAFSIAIPQLVTIVLTYIFLIAGFYIAYKELNLNKWLSKILLSLVLGGAIGNLIDRTVYGYVIDFIAIWKWPVFNIADSGIVVGILGIIVFYDKIKFRTGKLSS